MLRKTISFMAVVKYVETTQIMYKRLIYYFQSKKSTGPSSIAWNAFSYRSSHSSWGTTSSIKVESKLCTFSEQVDVDIPDRFSSHPMWCKTLHLRFDRTPAASGRTCRWITLLRAATWFSFLISEQANDWFLLDWCLLEWTDRQFLRVDEWRTDRRDILKFIWFVVCLLCGCDFKYKGSWRPGIFVKNC